MNEPTNDNDIDALSAFLFGQPGIGARWHAALTALIAERDALKEENNALRSRCKEHQDEVMDRVFEMDALRKRVAELEANPPAGNLRERLVCAALTGLLAHPSESHPMHNLREVAVYSATAADLTLAAMRKGGGA